jgi:3'-5' exoribonuclease
LLLGDRTGEIEAKAWDQPQEIAALFDRDDIVKVRGTIEVYNERPQLIVPRIRRCENGEFEEADFCPASPQDPDDMFASLASFVESVGDEKLRALLQSILDDEATDRAFRAAPGGTKLHHCCRGGLLQHTLSLCELIERVVEHYPRLNRDWLIAGALLHDIGKIEELTASRRLGYTTRGQLVGHVALGLEILERHVARVPDFSVETKN